uniref:Eukaryotic translation initiation factor n=1 Tax=Tanacetum cinerariifolium TaxID=118510 RepID=A0A699LAG1_TANCI|nr:eukaryotic translation initiation factor [Tanacetum cinerariifolium]
MNMELKSKLDEIKRLLDTLRDENIDTGVVSLIFDKAVADDYLNCPLYARLCSALITKLPSFPSHGGNLITFKGLLVKKVQDGFDCSGQNLSARDQGTVRMIERCARGDLCFVSALYHQKFVSEDFINKIVQMCGLDRMPFGPGASSS